MEEKEVQKDVSEELNQAEETDNTQYIEILSEFTGSDELAESYEQKTVTKMADCLIQARQKAAEFEDKHKRALAEFANFKKRSEAEKAGMYDNGVKSAVEKLLPVIDNFERAMASFKDEQKEDASYKGIEMIYNQFCEFLKNMNIEEVAGEGEEFNPNYHSAIMHIEDESIADNTVVKVLQKGYTLNDKVIRPAMVQVAN